MDLCALRDGFENEAAGVLATIGDFCQKSAAGQSGGGSLQIERDRPGVRTRDWAGLGREA